MMITATLGLFYEMLNEFASCKAKMKVGEEREKLSLLSLQQATEREIRAREKYRKSGWTVLTENKY